MDKCCQLESLPFVLAAARDGAGGFAGDFVRGVGIADKHIVATLRRAGGSAGIVAGGAAGRDHQSCGQNQRCGARAGKGRAGSGQMPPDRDEV